MELHNVRECPEKQTVEMNRFYWKESTQKLCISNLKGKYNKMNVLSRSISELHPL